MKIFLCKIITCLIFALFFLYHYITVNSHLGRLRKKIPKIEREARMLEWENEKLQYEIVRFESPAHLLEIAKMSAFKHLKYPYVDDIVEIKGESER